MKDLCQYGNRPEDEWEILPWIPDPRPPFKIWVKPEQIAPFFLIPHHPYALSLLLKINNGFRTEVFRRLGLTGSSGDWERLVRGVIQEFEENNSGVDLFHFDSDDDVFCVYSQYIDDLMLLSKMIRAACDNEKTMDVPLYCAVGLPRPAMIYMFFPPSATGDRDGGIEKAIAAASLSPMALMLVQFIIRSLIPSESASACRSKSSGTVIPFTGSGLRLSKTSYTSNRSLVSTFSG